MGGLFEQTTSFDDFLKFPVDFFTFGDVCLIQWGGGVVDERGYENYQLGFFMHKIF
jgi:hypothetical protein